MKPNNKLLYVHRLSNHPPALLKNISQNINKLLTNISSNQQVFNEAIAPYQQALEESGYNFKLKFDPQAKWATRKSKARNKKEQSPEKKDHLVQSSMGQQCQDQPE